MGMGEFLGLIDDVVVLDDVVLHFRGQLIKFCDSDAHVKSSEDVTQIFITVHPVVLSMHLPAQNPSGLHCLLLLLHLQFGFNVAVALLRHIFRNTQLVEAVSSSSGLW